MQHRPPTLRRAFVRLCGRRYAIVYLGLALAFAIAIGRSYDRHTGFTSSEVFGDRFRARRLPQLHDIPIYTYRGDGYDGQFYAQLAVAGNPLARELRVALDAPAYRSRRISCFRSWLTWLVWDVRPGYSMSLRSRAFSVGGF